VSSLALGTAAWFAGGPSGGAANGGFGAGSSGGGSSSGGSSGARRTDEDGAVNLLRAFRSAGGTLLDVIAGSAAESVLSRIIGATGSNGKNSSDRDELVLAVRATGDASRQSLLSQLDASLRRLGTSHIDLWQVPLGGPAVGLEETLAAVDQAVASGRVRYAGVIDHVGWRLARAATWQHAWPGRTPIVSDHVEYSLLSRAVEVDTAPAALELGVGLVVSAPFGGGALVGREQGERMGIGAERVARGEPRALGIIEAVATAADGLATTPVAVTLSWLLDRPGVSSVVIGARTGAQLTAALTARELTLPDAIRSALDDVSAPGLAAPGPVR
jgi:aryl-alcohol dehydrogenase-like predicted oxidoreductase